MKNILVRTFKEETLDKLANSIGMIQENKLLLIKDLYARLPYGVKVAAHKEGIYEISAIGGDGLIHVSNGEKEFDCMDIKPYLFPLSSMTDEQRIEWFKIIHKEHVTEKEENKVEYKYLDYLNKNHFDYRGLIGKGLAIDCTGLKGIY